MALPNKQQSKSTNIVYIFSSSYSSDGKNPDEKKLAYFKDNKGEKARFVHYQNRKIVESSKNVNKVKNMLGIPVPPKAAKTRKALPKATK